MSEPPCDKVVDFLRERPDFWTWLEFGVVQGWVTEPDCTTHNGLPVTPETEQAWEEGYDPCEIAMRVWEDNIQ